MQQCTAVSACEAAALRHGDGRFLPRTPFGFGMPHIRPSRQILTGDDRAVVSRIFGFQGLDGVVWSSGLCATGGCIPIASPYAPRSTVSTEATATEATSERAPCVKYCLVVAKPIPNPPGITKRRRLAA